MFHHTEDCGEVSRCIVMCGLKKANMKGPVTYWKIGIDRRGWNFGKVLPSNIV